MVDREREREKERERERGNVKSSDSQAGRLNRSHFQLL